MASRKILSVGVGACLAIAACGQAAALNPQPLPPGASGAANKGKLPDTAREGGALRCARQHVPCARPHKLICDQRSGRLLCLP